MIQALEGKDVKDLLLNVGSGGGAAPAAAATSGGGGAGGDAPEEEKKVEEKVEGRCLHSMYPTGDLFALTHVIRS